MDTHYPKKEERQTTDVFIFTAYTPCSGVFTNKGFVAAITLKTAITASELPFMQPNVRAIIASLALMEHCIGLEWILEQAAYKSRERE